MTPQPIAVVPLADLQAIIEAAVIRALAAQPARQTPPPTPQPHSVTRKDAAIMLGITPPTVRALLRRGVLAEDAIGKITTESIEQARHRKPAFCEQGTK
jgi:hypothetical protein